MADTNISWLKTILIKNEEDNRIVDILSADYESGSKVGDNYASVIVRANLRVVLGSGKVTSKKVIMKKALTDLPEEARQEMQGLFSLEGIVYENFLDALTDIISDYNLPYSKFWPDYIYSSHNVIMFDDLRVKGFALGKRQTGLDFDHAKLVYTNMARFHSLSMKAIADGVIYPKILPPYLLTDSKVGESFFKTSMTALADVIRDMWGSEWSRMEKKVRSMATTIVPKLKNIYKESTKFLVLNHGDCWVNNVMFKYGSNDSYTGPTDIKFLDFQISHFNSFGWDFAYFMHSSINPRNIEAYENKLIDIYCCEFSENLKRLGLNSALAPSVQDVKEELVRLRPYSLAVSCSILPVTCNPSDIKIEIDEMLNENSGKFRQLFEDKEFESSIQTMFKHFDKFGIFN